MKIKRPRFRPGWVRCDKCGVYADYAHMQYDNQVEPKRKIICDDCAAAKPEVLR